MSVKLTSLSYLGMAVETTLGTPVAPTGFVPILPGGFRPQDTPQFVPDTGYRGQPYDLFGEYLGTEEADYQVKGNFYPGSGGNFLAGIFGLDTVSGSAAPYTHTFSVVAVPPSFTLGDYYVAGYREWPGCRMDKLTLSFDPKGGLGYQAHYIGFPSQTTTAPTSQTFGQNPFLLGYTGALTVGGVADATLESAQISLSRAKSEAVFAVNNTQTPYDIFVGEFAADWDLTFFMEADTEYAYALSQATQIVAAKFTQPGTSDTLTLTSSALQFTKPTINRSGKFVTVELTGSAVYNATDAGVIQAVLKNSVSAAYSTTAAS